MNFLFKSMNPFFFWMLPDPELPKNRVPSNYDLMLARRIDGLEKIILHNPLEKCPHCGKLIPSGECKK